MAGEVPDNRPKGRGTGSNPRVRFESSFLERDEETAPPERVATKVFEDHSVSILSRNDSPDIPFTYSVNPYRGCEHGCIYCYARPTHEYLGFSAGLDFETRIMVKREAARLLADALSSPGWNPQPLTMSGVTDPYQPLEREHGITRACLEVMAEFRNPVSIITKSALVLRDLDLLQAMAAWNGVSVTLSVTSLNPDLARKMEPRAPAPALRLEAVARLNAAGIPAGVSASPMIPGLTDGELPAIIDAAAKAGARWVSYIPVRLPYGVKDLFVEWLEQVFPTRKERVLERIRSLRDGRLNDPRLGSRMQGSGPWAEQLRQLYRLGMRKSGFVELAAPLNTAAFRRPGGTQMELF